MATKLGFREAGSGRTLVLLHPVGLDSSFWDGVLQPLSARYRVVAVDVAGHGASPDAARPGRMAERVGDLVELLEAANAGPVTLIGVSFGGMIAQNVAIERPDLVAALVLAGCPGRIAPEARATILARGSKAEAGGMAAIVDATLERWFTPSFMSTVEVARVRRRLLNDNPSNWAAAWEAVAEHDALKRLGDCRAPTLVVTGEADLATPIEAKQALAVAIAGATLAVLPGAPHMMHIEQAEAFLAVVQSFLDAAPETTS